ncbi:ribosome maturation factor RimM [Aquibium sp. A9E412]|uniref:ribosome maturation factor RimM n=1 Tax=Aquibium sp. A9E412 TaxID=2976767 RepID=UPI0025B090E8|nr:ribosome maturation factor RimM [Aquibium sp. A9E412]MDN2565721.1 ribosome maturation factor RimM [Aquibium sp. A9E412]
MTARDPVRMAVLGAAHGIRGEIRVRAFTEDPMDFAAYGPLRSADGRRFTVTAVRPGKAGPIARFAEVADRSAAEALAGTELFVERAALPDDLEEDEFYQADLIGLAARTADGGALGRVVALHDFGAGDILELALADGRSAMIPFSRAAVPAVDLAAGTLTVEPHAAGLLASDDDRDDGETGEARAPAPAPRSTADGGAA